MKLYDFVNGLIDPASSCLLCLSLCAVGVAAHTNPREKGHSANKPSNDYGTSVNEQYKGTQTVKVGSVQDLTLSGSYVRALIAVINSKTFKETVGIRYLDTRAVRFSQEGQNYILYIRPRQDQLMEGGEVIFWVRKSDLRVIKTVTLQ